MKKFLPVLLVFLFACSEDTEENKIAPVDKDAKVELTTVRYDKLLKGMYQATKEGTDCSEYYKDKMAEHRRLLAHWLFGGRPDMDPDELAYLIDSLVINHPQLADRDLTYKMCSGWIRNEKTGKLMTSTGMLLDTLDKYLNPSLNLKDKMQEPLNLLRGHFPTIIPGKALVGTIMTGHDPRVRLDQFYPKDEMMAFMRDSTLFVMIGLDYFAGEKFPLIHPGLKQSSFYLKRFNDQYFSQRIMSRLVENMIHPPTHLIPEGGSPATQTDPQFLAQMLHSGIDNYILQQVLPDVREQDLFYWTDEEYAWAQKYEAVVYKHFLGLLYENQGYKFYDFLHPRPKINVQGLPANAPPMLGHYIGLQIINKYISRNPDMSLQKLVAQYDWRKILQESGYKPEV